MKTPTTNRRVFVPNLPTRYDAVTDCRVPSLDLNAAAAYGDLVQITAGPGGLASLEALEDAADKIRPEDYILCVGDVAVVIAFAVMARDRNNGTITLLRWDKNQRSYNAVELEL